MKKFIRFSCILSVTIFTFLLAGCSSDDNGDTKPTTPEQPAQINTIVDVASATPDLSTLVAALQRAELVETLQADGTFTVLAPTNAAFDAFLEAKEFASLEEVPADVLQQILLNHVISGDAALKAADLTALGSGYTDSSADGPDDGSKISLYFDTADGVKFNGISTVATADVEASNGIVHVVDAVIDLPTVVTFALADPNFSELAGALTTSTPSEDNVTFLNRTGDDISVPFTIFAPVNTAFAALTALPEEDELIAILNNHIITGDNVRTEEIIDGPSSATLQGDNLIFTVSDDAGISITDGTGNTEIKIIDPNNIQAINGVVHAIDTIIMPDTDN